MVAAVALVGVVVVAFAWMKVRRQRKAAGH